MIHLPRPEHPAAGTLGHAASARRTVREFTEDPLSLPDTGQLLWATQGFTSPNGLRAVPSASGLHPLSVTLAAGNIGDLDPGAYRYDSTSHGLVPVAHGDARDGLAAATSIEQPQLAMAAALIVVGADLSATRREQGARYAYLAAGNAVQSLYLQAATQGLGGVFVGGFDDATVLAFDPPLLPDGHAPLALFAVGHPVAG